MAVEATENQINAMAVTERVTSIFSLLGILFILATFLLGRGFDKPINRLIFLASWSNLGMNIATLIAEDGTTAGQNSSLCQFQAFAIQMCVEKTFRIEKFRLIAEAGSSGWMPCGHCACLSMSIWLYFVDGRHNVCELRNGNISWGVTDALLSPH